MPNNVSRSRCPTCDEISWHMKCSKCGNKTVIFRNCPKCNREIWGDNLIVKPDNRSTQCRACQYENCNKLRKEKRNARI